jgi:predicted small secreted protein
MTKLQYLIVSMVLITVSGCGTMGGAVSGAGQDLSRAGEWIRSR